MGAGRSRSVSISSPAGGDSDVDNKQISSYGVSAGSMFTNNDLDDEDYIAELEKRGITSLNQILDKQGFSGLPRQMSEEEFEQFVKDGGIHLARGIQASSEEQYDEYVDSLLHGDFYVAGGEAYYGQGMYAYGGEYTGYAGAYGRITNMALSPDSKVYTIERDKDFSKEVKDLFLKEETYFDYGQERTRFVYNRDNRLNKANNIYTGNTLVMKEMGIKPVEIKFSDFKGDVNAYLGADVKTRAKNKQIGREYLKKTISKEDYNLIREYNAPTKPNNAVLASKGYDAIRLAPEYVRATSKNTGEIWIILNRTKLTVLNEKGR